MPSSYSPLKVQLMETGENSGTWGEITNTNLGTALEEAIVGSSDIIFAGADVQLTLTNTNNTQPARHLRLNLTGSSGGERVLEVPAIEKMYLINNGLADAVTVKNATGTGVAVPGGKSMVVYNDGTNVTEGVTHVGTMSAGTMTATTLTATGDTSLNNLAVTGTFTPPSSTGTGAFVQADSPALVGTPTAPTPLTADNSTKLATTAYVTAKVQAATSGLSDPGTNGVVVRTSLGTTTARSIAAGTGISVSNGDGVSGNPTITNTGVTSVNGLTGAVTISTGGLADPGNNGYVARTSAGVTAARTLTAGSGISISNTTGGGNPVFTNTGVLSVNGQTGNVTVSSGVSSVDGATGAVNLANLASFAKQLGTTGYQKLPGGLTIQWGFVSRTAGGQVAITFLYTYQSACYSVVLSPVQLGDSGGGMDGFPQIASSPTTSGFTLSQNTGKDTYWMAIGY